jgi:hypothetical protein
MYWWLVRERPRGSLGKICSRKLAKVPAQCAAVLLGEIAKRLQQARLALFSIVESGYRIIHEATFRPSATLDRRGARRSFTFSE